MKLAKSLFYTETVSHYQIELPSVINSYEIMKDLDKGTYSAVLLVREINLNKIFAAKVIPIRGNEDEKQLALINREISILNDLSHPNIVKLFESFEFFNRKKEKFYILIEEYCSNGDLLKYISTKSKKSKKEIRSISRGITEGIKYLHDEGIAHCDIKPSNILLTKNKIPKICDFNMSKYIRNPGPNSRAGTTAYSPPEIYLAKPIDFLKADIWSLGVTLFVISELKLPYKSINDILMGKISMQTENTLLINFIEKCLAYTPSRRATPDDLLEDPYLEIDDKEKEDENDFLLVLKNDTFALDHKTSPNMRDAKEFQKWGWKILQESGNNDNSKQNHDNDDTSNQNNDRNNDNNNDNNSNNSNNNNNNDNNSNNNMNNNNSNNNSNINSKQNHDSNNDNNENDDSNNDNNDNYTNNQIYDNKNCNENNDTSNLSRDDDDYVDIDVDDVDVDDVDDIDDMSVLLELGFDFGFQEDDQSGDEQIGGQENERMNIQEYLANEDDGYEKAVDKVCDNVLMVKFHKKKA